MKQIANWPLRELLIAYIEKIMAQAEATHRHAQILYQIQVVFGGDKKPPVIPEVLRSRYKP